MALDNLASVAINTSLLCGDSIELVLGTGSDITFDWDGTDGELDFAAANSVLNIGQTAPSDIELFGAAGYNLYWDASADELIFYDSAVLWFGGTMGANDGIFMYFDGTSDFHIDGSTANDVVNFGATVDVDIAFHGGTPGSDVTWDSSEDIWSFLDNVKCAFGDADDLYLNFNAADLELRQTAVGVGGFKFGVDDVGIDVTWYSDTASDFWWWDASSNLVIFEDVGIRMDGAAVNYTTAISTDSLLIDATDGANAVLILGTAGTHGLDVTFQAATASDFIKWDAASATLTFTDCDAVFMDDDYIFFGSASGGDISISYENAGDTLDIAQVTDGTGSVDFIDVPVAITGADSAGTLLTILGVDTTGNTDTVLIDHSGDGYAINIDLNEATSDGIKVEAYTNHTVPLILLDGDTAGFLGASNVGMLTIQNDIELTNVNSSALVIDVGATKPKDAAEGYCLRIIDTSVVSTANTAYAAYIDSTANHGLKIETRAVAATNLTLSGVAAQTASLMIVDASTGSGWDGADDTGAFEITSDSILVANGATLFRVESSAQQKAGSEGALARFENTGAAQADAVMVEIVAKDETEYALTVGAGISNFEAHGIMTAFGGGTDLTGTPTAAEFTGEFTATALTRAGFVGVAEDSGSGVNYLVVSDGSTWHYIALTAAS
jgi:hypothetical protein